MAERLEVTPPRADTPAGLRRLTGYLYAQFTKIQQRWSSGASGTFTTTDGKTVTVTDGLITKIE